MVSKCHYAPIIHTFFGMWQNCNDISERIKPVVTYICLGRWWRWRWLRTGSRGGRWDMERIMIMSQFVHNNAFLGGNREWLIKQMNAELDCLFNLEWYTTFRRLAWPSGDPVERWIWSSGDKHREFYWRWKEGTKIYLLPQIRYICIMMEFIVVRWLENG